MPRVLLTGFCAVPGPRRAGVQLRHVIRSLTPLHSVDLLVAREGDQAYVERQGSVRVLRVPTQDADLRLQIQAFQRALKRQLDGADYDVVHCRDSWSAIPVLEARARLGYAVVYDLSRSPLGETNFEPELDAQYARDEDACLAAADLVLAPTPLAVKVLQSRGKPERIMLSPPGVDVDRFDWEAPAPATPPRILYLGTLDPGRGIRILIRAMAAVVRETDARLVLAGAMVPRFEPTLRDAIREHGLTDKVEIVGPVDHDQLPALLATATVCVVPAAADLTPSPFALFPTKILEYMACRCAIVAPRRETLAHVVENNREALLFEPGDPQDLARKVLRLLAEPMMRERLAYNAYERVRRDFTASAARRALRTAYHLLSARFAVPTIDSSVEDAPKSELLADDDFEATVFEDAPASPTVDTAVSRRIPLDEALQSLGEAEGVASATGEARSSPVSSDADDVPDETMERVPVLAAPHDSRAWSVSGLILPPSAAPDDWSLADEGSDAEEVRVIEVDDVGGELLAEEGTTIEGLAIRSSAPASMMESSFVAGEIDVPTPPLARDPDTGLGDPPAALFGAESDPDTGSRTPPLERR